MPAYGNKGEIDMWNRLTEVEKRYEEITQRLYDPDVYKRQTVPLLMWGTSKNKLYPPYNEKTHSFLSMQ